MFYTFDISRLPIVKRFYTVTRNTVWQTADEEHILIVITEGKCAFSMDGEAFEVQKGDVVYIPANCSYTRSHIDGTMCTMSYVHFDLFSEAKQREIPHLLEEIYETKKQLNEQLVLDDRVKIYPQSIYLQNCNRGNDFEVLCGYLESIHLISAKNEMMCYLQSVLSFCALLTYVSKGNIDLLHVEYEQEVFPALPPNLKKAIRYIRENYSEPITLENLASYCNVSRQQMTRYFNKEFGKAPITYVLEYKVSKAKHLLFRNPHLSIKQIAYELGFQDAHYFSRMFRKVTGETPGEYRDRVVNYIPPKPDEEPLK